jgi:hypothetical protein
LCVPTTTINRPAGRGQRNSIGAGMAGPAHLVLTATDLGRSLISFATGPCRGPAVGFGRNHAFRPRRIRPARDDPTVTHQVLPNTDRWIIGFRHAPAMQGREGGYGIDRLARGALSLRITKNRAYLVSSRLVSAALSHQGICPCMTRFRGGPKSSLTSLI